MIRKLIEKKIRFIVFILPLIFFLLIGISAFYFAIKFPKNVPIYGWIIILIFLIVPIILIYRFIYGFTISVKQQKQIEDNRNKLTYSSKGLIIEMPLFDKNCFIDWRSIDAVIYYNYFVSSDFTIYNEGYTFYLNTIPVYIKYEKEWWLNKLFPKDSRSKIIDIKNDTRHFSEIPNVLHDYLNLEVEIDFKDPMKGTLISRHTYQNRNKSTIVERWKPINNEAEQIVFDRYNRSIEEIKKLYS